VGAVLDHVVQEKLACEPFADQAAKDIRRRNDNRVKGA
jgi:hypothetical protein